MPIRVRLTAAFALAMVLVLAAAAAFVYVRLRNDLDETVAEGLHARADAVAAGAPPGGEAEETFARVLTPRGAVIARHGGARGPVLTPGEVRRAREETVVVDREIDGIEGRARVLAHAAAGGRVVVVGQSLDDRDETLHGLVVSFAIGGAAAVLLASLAGYALASAGMAPVEAMRRRAAEVSLRDDEQPLPLPAAHDEIRRLGETLNDMLGRLRRSFQRERRFVSDAGHELRTPIAVLKAELDAALRSGDHTPEAREALTVALAECDHLAQLADDLLVLAQAGEGALPVRPEPCSARALLAGARDRFADRAAQEGRRISVDAPDGLAVRADPLRLRQALGNLVDNALRHGEGDISLTASPADTGVALEIADEGPGIATALGDGAFERFTRGDEARTRGGAGLGLAIVRAIAEAHGGEASAGRAPGGRVRIWLPDAGTTPTGPGRELGRALAGETGDA